MFFPEQFHPAFGVIRSSVADSSDESNLFTFLDSDGQFSNNMKRVVKNTSADPRMPVGDHTYATDGHWHMATVTSQPNGTKGYRQAKCFTRPCFHRFSWISSWSAGCLLQYAVTLRLYALVLAGWQGRPVTYDRFGT